MKDLYIIDGYNFIFNNYIKKKKSAEAIAYLRDKLLEILSQFKEYQGCHIIVVFDARHGSSLSRGKEKLENMEIIFSMKGETADSIVEKIVHENTRFERVFVVTSDYHQQKVIFRKNIYRKSAREFTLELKDFKSKIAAQLKLHNSQNEQSFHVFERRLDSETRQKFDTIRKSGNNR